MADTAQTAAPAAAAPSAIKSFSQILADLGGLFGIFAAIEPSQTTTAIAQAVPTVVQVAQAEAQASDTGATPVQLAQVGVAGAAAVAENVFTGSAKNIVGAVVQGLPEIEQFVADLGNMFNAATSPAAAEVIPPQAEATMAASSVSETGEPAKEGVAAPAATTAAPTSMESQAEVQLEQRQGA